MRNNIVVCVAGGFDPLRYGHVSHMKEARKLGDELVVIVNTDNHMKMKKHYCFMPLEERMAIIAELPFVNRVIRSIDVGLTVTETLRMLRPQKFAKGGDRTPDNMPQDEITVCKEIGCEIVYDVGEPKKGSSQELVRHAVEQVKVWR